MRQSTFIKHRAFWKTELGLYVHGDCVQRKIFWSLDWHWDLIRNYDGDCTLRKYIIYTYYNDKVYKKF
jgi:hypothetical protein